MVNTLLSVLSTMQPFHSNPTIAEQQTGPPSNMSTESLNTINFISSLRQQALLLGDYNAYRQLCSRRLSKLRKRLGKVKNSDLKSSKKDSYKLVPVTAHDIANENTNAHLFIYSSERAWAHAMHMKSLITDDPESASRSIKDHIKSRLQKAHRHASQLRDLFSDLASKATDVDIVEATAYASSLAGAVAFEKAHWEDALREFAIARTSYDTLSFAVKSDIYKEFLTSTVDPSLRYAAYQLEIPRSVDTTGLAKQFFPQQDQALIETLKGLNPKVLGGGDATEVEDGETAIVISSVNWRGRVAAIDEADIAVALGNAQKAETSLQAYMSGNPNQDQAAAFDELLQAWQDSVDATKREIDRATADGVSTTDPKLQKLQLVFTYVNYNLISRRIGRNRVMVDAISRTNTKTEKKVNSLKELVVLYDAILQSLEQINELPGVAADEEFGKELEAKRNFFAALRCSAIASSHALINNRKGALALYHRASTYLTNAAPHISSSPELDSVRGLEVQAKEVAAVKVQLQGEVERFRALVEMEKMTTKLEESQRLPYNPPPLLKTLSDFPEKGVDFSNLVNFPPRVEPVPAKPIFFDIAWNYIQYPGEQRTESKETKAQQQQESGKKGGLFGSLWGR